MEESTLHAFACQSPSACSRRDNTSERRTAVQRLVVCITLTLTGITPFAVADGRSLSDVEYSRIHAQTVTAFGIEAFPGGASSLRIAPGAVAPGDASDTPPQHELLLIERRPMPKASTVRLADVYVYDYSREVLVHRVVDPQTGSIHHEEEQTDQQLPLTRNEINQAQNILFGDTFSAAALEQIIVRATGQTASLSNLQFKAVVFVADASESGNARRCGRLRCAELLIYTADEQIALDVRPVVSLAAGRVLALRQLRTGGVQ